MSPRPPWRLLLLLVLLHATSAEQAAAQAPAAGDPAARRDAIELHYEAAETYQLAGDFDRAAREYRRVIAESLRRVAGLKVSLGEPSEALGLLERGASVDPLHTVLRLELAAAHYRNGRMDDAEAQAKAALEQQPQDSEVLLFMGNLHFVRGRFEEALQYLEPAFHQSRDLGTAYALALAHLKLKQPANAAMLFDELLATLAPSPELHLLIGRAYLETEHLEMAVRYLQRAAEGAPQTASTQAYLGLARLMQNDPEAAEQSLQAAVALQDDAYHRLYLGILRAAQQRWQEAESEFDAAVGLQPGLQVANELLAAVQGRESGSRKPAPSSGFQGLSTADMVARVAASRQRDSVLQSGSAGPQPRPEAADEHLDDLSDALGNAYHNLGVIYAQRGAFAAAAEHFSQAAQWTPQLETVDRNWGMAAFRAQLFQEAVAPLSRRLTSQPSDRTVREMLGLCLFFTDEYLRAADVFRPLLAALPENPGLLYAMGVSAARTGDAASAARIFQEMLARNPDGAEVRLLLGQAHAGEGDFEQALAEFFRAAKLDPRLPQVHYSAGIVYLQQGRMDAAEQAFRAELVLDPEHVAARYHLAVALLALQKNEEAVEALQHVLQRQPEHADAHYQMGRALLEQGDLSAAVQRLETAVRLQPESDHAYYQLSQAYRRQGRMADAQSALENYRNIRERTRASRPAQPEQ